MPAFSKKEVEAIEFIVENKLTTTVNMRGFYRTYIAGVHVGDDLSYPKSRSTLAKFNVDKLPVTKVMVQYD